MSDISPIGRSAASNLGHAGRINRPSAPAGSPKRGADRVELSDAARLLGKIRDVPDIRRHLVDDVRAQIADGTYDTSSKVDALLDNLIEDLI